MRQLWQLLAAVVEPRGRERRPWPRRARSVCRLAPGRKAHGALWGLEGRLEGAEMTLVTAASSGLCPGGLCVSRGRALLSPRPALSTRLPCRQGWAQSCPGIQLAEGIQGRVVVCWTTLGGYPASELRSDPTGRGRWRVAPLLPAGLQSGLHSAPLSGVPAPEPVLLWKVSPSPVLPSCWEQNHILPKDTVKPSALEPVDVTCLGNRIFVARTKTRSCCVWMGPTPQGPVIFSEGGLDTDPGGGGRVKTVASSRRPGDIWDCWQ